MDIINQNPDLAIIYIIIALVIVGFFVNKSVDKKLNRFFNMPTFNMKDFPDMQVILEWHLERAYKIIYKDEILVFSAEGMTVREEDYTKIQKHFLNLSIDLMGDTLLNHLTWFYGNEMVLYRNMCLYFDESYESDTLRDESIKAQMGEELTSTPLA